ncbi:MAG: phosphotransferase, partial [Candidatus Dormibacteraeota bacterium]|nr:phosphotransferase [Candidatus Dormibacteraeota bacterium]
GESMRPGGAWHHLSPSGGPREEIDVAIRQFEAAEVRVPPGLSALYDRVRDALEELDDGHDLPHAFVHPDFVPVNAITTADDGRVIVDWSGAGRGPRLWSLALLLLAGGMRSLRLVDVAITRYARYVELEDEELTRLAGVIPARPLTMDVWSFCHGRRGLGEVYHGLQYNREAAERIAEQVRTSLDRRRF